MGNERRAPLARARAHARSSPAAARLMRPLLRCLARPMKEEWKMRPYLGVLPLVLSALPSEGVGVSVCG